MLGNKFKKCTIKMITLSYRDSYSVFPLLLLRDVQGGHHHSKAPQFRGPCGSFPEEMEGFFGEQGSNPSMQPSTKLPAHIQPS